MRMRTSFEKKEVVDRISPKHLASKQGHCTRTNMEVHAGRLAGSPGSSMRLLAKYHVAAKPSPPFEFPFDSSSKGLPKSSCKRLDGLPKPGQLDFACMRC